MAFEKEKNGGMLGFEQKLWLAADKLRGNMDAAEYKHAVLGLIFLKYISDTCERSMNKSFARGMNLGHFINEPGNNTWRQIVEYSHNPKVGEKINKIMTVLENENPPLKDTLPKDYNKPSLDKKRLGELIRLIDTISMNKDGKNSDDVLGRVYEYFLGGFAQAEGQRGGQFYTPKSVVKLLVEMMAPYNGKVFDPCCGSGGMFVQSDNFIRAHEGKQTDISVFGQESNFTTWRLCKLNLWLHGIRGDVQWGDSFLEDHHKELKADFIISNPPFNDSDWGRDEMTSDKRWRYGIPPPNNANYAWIQNYIFHLSDTGAAGFVLTNGALSSNSPSEFSIREKIVEDDIIDCIVVLPDKLFYNTQISACLWFITKDKKNTKFRDRSGKVLFIDASDLGVLVSKKHRELRDEEIQKIAKTYHQWKSKTKGYKNIPGYCKSATLSEIREHKYALVPGRYVGCTPLKLEALTPEQVRKLKEIFHSRFSKVKELEKNSLAFMEKIM